MIDSAPAPGEAVRACAPHPGPERGGCPPTRTHPRGEAEIRHQAAWCRREAEKIVLDIRVQPRASRDRVVGSQGARLKIQVTAAPVDDAANARVIGLLAKAFGVPKSAIRVVSGRHARDKRIEIAGPRRTPDWLAPPGTMPGHSSQP